MNETPQDAGLRLMLRGMRRDIAPARDLWPGIARAIIADQAAAPLARRRAWPVAIAASLLLVAGLAWRMQPAVPASPVQLSDAEHGPAAAAIDAQYRQALQQLRPGPVPAAVQPGLEALDAGVVQIHAALRRAPDSRLLLDQLQRTYRQRLALTVQAAAS